MRHVVLVVAALVALSLPAPAQSTHATLRIVEVLSDPDAGQREFVELLNGGNASVELAGWRLRDVPTASGATNTFTFPTWRLSPGERVVVWGGGAADGHGPAWSNAAVWNNAGDGVTLLNPAGQVAAWVGYGAVVPPANETGALGPKPEKGRSVTFEGVFATGPPTPGFAAGSTGALLEFVVANAAPTVVFLGLPDRVRPQQALRLDLLAQDGNGPSDLAAWSLAVNGRSVASGQGAPVAPISLQVPDNATAIVLAARVTDRAGASANATATLPVRWNDLELVFPTGPFMGELRPGEVVGSVLPLTLRNDAATPRTPRLDVGDLRGPGQASLVGHLEIGLERGNATHWIRYDGPLTALPEIPGGAEVPLRLRLQLPDGLPAGRYGASVAVVG
ncbi:MAG: lamin tail domain-containing protein [Candidatus Thermoplasmatota archaeon]